MKENNGVHIQEAVDSTHCKRHNAPQGSPCWSIAKNVKDHEGYYSAICGRRIRLAGFVGKISPSAIRVKASSFSPRTNNK